MIIKKISCDGFKNLKGISFEPDENLNVIWGDNAQGKTNLLEAIWLCSGVSSFRGTKDRGFIAFDRDKCNISVDFQNIQRVQNISVEIFSENLKKKNITKNGVKLPFMSKLFGEMVCVIFTPEDLFLASGSPDVRRRFIDLSISQVSVSYARVVSAYERVINQRNSLLKEIAFSNGDKNLLITYDEQLATYGAYMSYRRKMYCDALQLVASDLYKDISDGKEIFNLYYKSTIFKQNEYQDPEKAMKEQYFEALRKNEADDIRLGFTTVGAHRDDIELKINDLSVKEFGSQGQKRSSALVLKLAAAYIYYNQTNEAPIILLDDILSELDLKRQAFVLNKIKNMQVFITCCNKQEVGLIEKGLAINIDDGKIVRG